MRVQPDDDLYSFEPVRVSKGNGDKEALIFARYRAWGYFVGLNLLALALTLGLGLGPIGALAAVTWASVGTLGLLRVLDPNRGLFDLAAAATADLTSWAQRPRRQAALTLTSRRLS